MATASTIKFDRRKRPYHDWPTERRTLIGCSPAQLTTQLAQQPTPDAAYETAWTRRGPMRRAGAYVAITLERQVDPLVQAIIEQGRRGPHSIFAAVLAELGYL